MTEQEAHDLLHEILPRGGTVTLSRTQWSRSTVGAGPVYHTTDGDWHVTVTIPGEVDQVESAFAATLPQAIERIKVSLRELLTQTKPPKLASPSLHRPDQDRRQVS